MLSIITPHLAHPSLLTGVFETLENEFHALVDDQGLFAASGFSFWTPVGVAPVFHWGTPVCPTPLSFFLFFFPHCSCFHSDCDDYSPQRVTWPHSMLPHLLWRCTNILQGQMFASWLVCCIIVIQLTIVELKTNFIYSSYFCLQYIYMCLPLVVKLEFSDVGINCSLHCKFDHIIAMHCTQILHVLCLLNNVFLKSAI